MSAKKQNQEETVEISKSELEELRKLKREAEEKEKRMREAQQKSEAIDGISVLQKLVRKESSWETVIGAAVECLSVGQKEVAEFSENGGLSTRIMCARQAIAYMYRANLLHPDFKASIDYWLNMADD